MLDTGEVYTRPWQTLHASMMHECAWGPFLEQPRRDDDATPTPDRR